MTDFVYRDERGFLFLAPPPQPSPNDLEDVFSWLDSWYADYVFDAYQQDGGPSGMPARFSQSLSDVPAGLVGTEAWATCLWWLKRALAQQDGLDVAVGLFGSPGTGKTTLLAATCYDITRGYGQTVGAFYDARELTTWLKAADQPVYERNARMSKICQEKVVFIDDIGVESEHDWDRALICELFETRYANGLATNFSTNIPPKRLADRYSDRTADRIKQTTRIITMVGQSHRKRNHI